MARTKIEFYRLYEDLRELPDQQRAVALEYVKRYDMVAACKKAGYEDPEGEAKKLLKSKRFKRAVGHLQYRNAELSQLQRMDILEELSKLAMRDILDFCDENGVLQCDLSKVPPHARRCIDGIEVRQKLSRQGEVIGQTIKVKLVPKLPAIEMLMRHMGMFAPQEHKHEHTMNWDELFQAERRARTDVIEGEIQKAALPPKDE